MLENVGSKMERDAGRWKSSTPPELVIGSETDARLELGVVKTSIKKLEKRKCELCQELEDVRTWIQDAKKRERTLEVFLTPVQVVTGRTHRIDLTLSEDEFVAALKEVRGGGKQNGK